MLLGSSATVYKSILLTTLTLCAEKVISGRTKDKRKHLTREVEALRKTGVINDHCPYIVQFLDCIQSPRDATISLCLEYCDLGSLQDLINNGGTKNEFILRQLIFQILSGLSYLHTHSIIHRDLKPGNVLLNSKGEVKISDFGLSKEFNEDASQQSFVGTYSYMSPERMSGQHYTFAADIWSAGLTIHAVAVGKYPYEIKNDYWAILQVNHTIYQSSVLLTTSTHLYLFFFICCRQYKKRSLLYRRVKRFQVCFETS
jgi:serine/threonine protein kinase